MEETEGEEDRVVGGVPINHCPIIAQQARWVIGIVRRYGRQTPLHIEIQKEEIMAKRNTHSFKKFQKEQKRKKKAKEKMERRQGKKDPETEGDNKTD